MPEVDGVQTDKSAIAFLIVAHGDPEHLGRLTSALTPYGSVFVHVDGKMPLEPFKAACPGEVCFVEDRTPVYWCGYSTVKAELKLIRMALRESPNARRFVQLSGSDYPCRPLEEFVSMLETESDRQHIRGFDMLASKHHEWHVLTWHFQDPLFTGDRILYRIIRRLQLKLQIKRRYRLKLKPVYGNTWWGLTRACIQDVLKQLDDDPKIARFYRFTWCPDEHLFHTLVRNSPFAATASEVEPFASQGAAAMANYHLIHPSLAKTYTLEDLDEILTSRKYFVRKLNSADSGSLRDRLDEIIGSPRVDSLGAS